MHHAASTLQISTTPLRWLFVAVVVLHALCVLLAQRLQWPTASAWLVPLLLQLGHAVASGKLYPSAGAIILGRTGAQLGAVLALSTLAIGSLADIGTTTATSPSVPVWGLAALQAALGITMQTLWSGFKANTPPTSTSTDIPPSTATVKALQLALQDWATHSPAWLNNTNTALQQLQYAIETLTHTVTAHSTANANAVHTPPDSHWETVITPLTEAVKHLHDQICSHTNGLETLSQLAQHQQVLQHSVQQQLKTLDTLGGVLVRLDTTLQRSLTNSPTPQLSTELPPSLQALLADHAKTRMHVDIALTDLAHKLEANTLATRVAATTLGHKIDASVQNTINVSQKLHAAASASTLVANKLNAVALADIQAASTLQALGQHANDGLGKLDQTLDLMQVVIRDLSGLDRALRAQSAQLTQVAQRIQDVKVVVESPSAAPPVTVTRIHRLHDEPAPSIPAAPSQNQTHAVTDTMSTRIWTVPTTSLSTTAGRQSSTEVSAPNTEI